MPGTEPARPAEDSGPRYPHHPHFIKAEPIDSSTAKYYFRPFTGSEPEPTLDYIEGTFEDEALRREWNEREYEIEAALKLWMTARYEARVIPLIKATAEARPPVDDALQRMRAAWDALDNALVGQVAVKQLLDAQDDALRVMREWEDRYAYPLAEAEDDQPYYVREYVADWQGIARGLGYDVNWDIGFYYKGDRYSSSSYSESPLEDLQRTVDKQRGRLEEIAKYATTETAEK
jgi:hypothetical protein